MEPDNETLPSFSYRKQSTVNPYRPFIYALILSFGVMLGYLINTLTLGKQPIIGSSYNQVDEILNYIESKYVDTVNRTQLREQAISKILSGLDPHSVYVPASSVGEMNESLEGNFEGIGIEFSIVQDTITVVNAIPGGPSELIGMKAGDRIVKINDTLAAGVNIKDFEVKKLLRGSKGTKVKVTVLRGESNVLITFDIERNKIPLYSVDAAYLIDKQTGYIRINNFGSTTYNEFMGKVGELKKKGMESLIIDLRDNPGGYLQAATMIADELLAGEKMIVYTQGKSYSRQNYMARHSGIFEEGKLCILINQYSASASEILAGAIQDWDRGTIIGRTSFGKGLVQEQYILKDGSALRLTVARYYIPSGRSIQRPYENGIESYNNEIYDRYMRGEFIHEDSLILNDTTTYKTSNGRIVYGGGGIRPDIFVPIDTSLNNAKLTRIRIFIPEFVYKYTSLHTDFIARYQSPAEFSNKFEVSNALLQEFYAYAKAAGWKSEPSINEGINQKVKLLLKAYFGRQAWRSEGFYYIINQNDNVIQEALSKIK